MTVSNCTVVLHKIIVFTQELLSKFISISILELSRQTRPHEMGTSHVHRITIVLRIYRFSHARYRYLLRFSTNVRRAQPKLAQTLTCKNYIKLANPQINQSPCLHSLFSSVLIHPNRLIYTTAGRLDIHCEAERFLLLVGIFCHNVLGIPNRPKHSVKFVCLCSNYSRSLGWLDQLFILTRQA